MDITLIENFQKQINVQFNEMVVSLLEQYQSELEDLNHVLLKTTELIKEKESMMSELQKQVDDNKFEESNFNNVSIIQNLNNQILELTSKNQLLTTSLNIRNSRNSEPSVAAEEPEPEPVAEPSAEPAAEPAAEPVAEPVPVEEEEEVNEEEEGEEEEVEVTEIEYMGKSYYVENDIVHSKKKSGAMGKKVGVMVNGKPELDNDKDKKKKKKKKNKN